MFNYFLFCCFIIATANGIRTDYTGFQVYRLEPKNIDQITTLYDLTNDESYDFWSPLNFDLKPIDVMVNPKSQTRFLQFLEDHGIKYSIYIDDVNSSFQREDLFQKLLPRKTGITFTNFHRYDEINAYLADLARTYSDLVRLESIGKSFEGRDMKIVQISTNHKIGKPIIFIDAGIHAREWLAPAQALYIIQQLVENPANRYLLRKVDWHILPVMNPDGYEFSHEYNRYWRKTRSFQGRACIGVDANRNFGFYWGTVGASKSPCVDTFMGPSPFSEIEARNLRDYINNNSQYIKLYLTLHSYGNYILYPWGYTSQLPDNAFELNSLGQGVNRAIMAAGGQKYTVGSSTNVLYAAAGGSDDWAKAEAGVALSYTIELPGGRNSGFHPESDEIYPFVSQTFEGITVFGKYIALKFG